MSDSFKMKLALELLGTLGKNGILVRFYLTNAEITAHIVSFA